LTKRLVNPDLKILVSIRCSETVAFQVCDSGEAVSDELKELLFNAPVASDSGLGIGLYQAAKHAETSGYTLSLTSNSRGKVCFSLTENHPAASIRR
jgi:signal transduction histidine kinase